MKSHQDYKRAFASWLNDARLQECRPGWSNILRSTLNHAQALAAVR
jgi:hypothetical protein